MENSEFIRPAQTAESLQLTPVSSGATCETFKYQQWNKWFLLKRLKPSLRNDPAAIAVFEKEFDLGIHLDHPGIARYFDKGADGEGIFLVEEYIDGETLADFVKNAAPLPAAEVRRIFGEMADAVSYLHSMGIVHADLKPDNVMITRQGHHPKLIDLGFSGQYSYQTLNGKDTDTRSDVLALGKILSVLSTGRFQNVVRKATDENPDRRYPTPEAMERALNRKAGRQLALAVALLLLGLAIAYPTWRMKTMPAPPFTAVRDTLYIKDTLVIRDTIVSVQTAADSNPLETQFLQAFRKRSKQLWDPFFASFESIDEENFTYLQPQYQKRFEEFMELQKEIVKEWTAKYPAKADDFERLSNEEFGKIANNNRFLSETARWQKKLRATQGLD